MEEQVVAKKANKGIIILVVVLVLVIVGLIGYIVIDKNNKPVEAPNTNNTNNTKKPEVKEVELTQEEITDLTKIADKINDGFSKYYPITDLSVIDNQDLLRLGEEGLYDWNTGNTFTSAQVEANVKKYFGNSVTVKHEGIKCNLNCEEPLFSYDGNGTYSYNKNHPGHGGSGGMDAYTFYDNGTKKGNTITISFKVVYQSYPDIGPSYQLYANYNDKTPIYTAEDPENANITEEFASNYKDQASTITFTFEVSEDGVYSVKTITVK